MKVLVGIPARMGSTRFPGKPLAKILNMTMIEHVFRRSELAKKVDQVFVATCDEEIASIVSGFDGTVLMTSKDIARAGLRVAEACRQLMLNDDDIIMVVQGDEPLVHPETIDQGIEALLMDERLQMGTMVAEATEAEWLDRNEVKVVTDIDQNILYMSRSPIPSDTRGRPGRRLKQLGIMPYRHSMLMEFQQLSPTSLELAESVELMRAVERGIKVRAIKTNFMNISVDTEQDRLEAEAAMQHDPIYGLYSAYNKVRG